MQIASLSPDLAREPGALADAVSRKSVVVLRGADLSDAALSALLSAMGPRLFTSGETEVDGQPDLNVVTNVGRATPPRSRYHTDSSYYPRPPAFTALRPVDVPRAGGATLFLCTGAALDTLPQTLRKDLEGRRIRHSVSGVTPAPGEPTESDHPALRRHPVTGRAHLFVTVPERLSALDGMDDADTPPLMQSVYAHAISGPCARHDWRPGDLLIWDNRSTLHRGDHAAVIGDRTLHRGMVEGEIPEMA